MNEIILNYGETPYSNLTRDELLLHVHRMHSTIVSSYNELSKIKEMIPNNDVYWGDDGMGGRALKKCEQSLSHSNKYTDSYISYFRYADDLLFDNLKNIDEKWGICECGTLSTGQIGKAHKDCIKYSNCNGVFEAITFDDLKI